MLAVTTHNKLRSWRFCGQMMRARRHVKEQLAATPGLIRSVSAVASPTEFLTMTIWEDRQAMFNFMSSGAHENVMWMFARWSASFWSMRWIPTTEEEGAWEELSLTSLLGTGDHSWQAALPRSPQLPPSVKGSARNIGRRFIDPSGSGIYAVTALVNVSSPQRLWALLSAARTFRHGTDHPQLLRWSIGSIEPRHFLVLTLWRDLSGSSAQVLGELRQQLRARWAMGWTAGEYEIGHWNGLRLRQLASIRTREQRMRSETGEHVGSEPI